MKMKAGTGLMSMEIELTPIGTEFIPKGTDHISVDINLVPLDTD